MIVVIDGPGLSHRQWHTFGDKDGGELNSFGFYRSLNKIIRDWDASTVFVLWDRGMPAHRLVQEETYKADRPDYHTTAAPMFQSRKHLRENLPKVGVHSIKIEGTEADDLSILFSHVLFPNEKGIFIGGDYDWAQSITENWSMQHISHAGKKILDLNWLKEYTRDEEDPKRKYLLIKSLIGDGSDNIHGIHGVGYSNALKLSEKIMKGEELPNSVVGRRTQESIERIHENFRMMDFDWILPRHDIIEELGRQAALTNFDYKHTDWVRVQSQLGKHGCYNLWKSFESLKTSGEKYVNTIQNYIRENDSTS